MAVQTSQADFQVWDLSRHVSECPKGDVEYTLRMLFDMWRMQLHSKIEGMIREHHLPKADAVALRESTERLTATWRASTLEAIEKLP